MRARECNNPSPACKGQICQPDDDADGNFKVLECDEGECPTTCDYNGVSHTNGEVILQHSDANTCVEW